MNILLIDKRVSRYEDIVAAIDPALAVGVVFDYFEDTFDTLKARIEALGLTTINTTVSGTGNSVGLIQHNYRAPRFSMLASADLAPVAQVAAQDPELTGWAQFRDFVVWCNTEFSVAHFDLMACALYSDPDWKYVIDTLSLPGQTGVEIRASTDNTGSAAQGGNWFLESHTGVNLKGTYFTELIEEYVGTLYIYPYNREYSTKGIATGSVITWGNSNYGSNSDAVSEYLGSGVVAVYSNFFAFAALKSDGSVITWGNSTSGGDSSAVSADLVSGVVAVYSTFSAFAALKSDGSVITWGNSTDGGNSSSVSLVGVVVVYHNAYAFAALKSDGSVITWGNSTSGGNSNYPVSNGSNLNSGVVSIYSTGFAFAALKSDGSVITWGRSIYGGDSSAVSADLVSGVVAVYSTFSTFAALKSDGRVVVWGDSRYGGDSSAVSADLGSGVVAVYSTFSTFAALKSDGRVVVWGDLSYGGDSSAVSADLNSGVVAVYSNFFAFAALKSDGSVITWGNSTDGGNSSSVSLVGVVVVYHNGYAFAALKSDGSVITWGNSTYGGNSSAVSTDLNSGVVSIYSTGYAFAALKSDGSVITWGRSIYGGVSSAVSADLVSGVVAIYSTDGAFAALISTATIFDLSVAYYTDMDRYDILRKKENRRRVNLTTLNNNVFTLSGTRNLQVINPNIPSDKTLRIIVPDYVVSSYSITSAATIPSGAGSVIIACDEGEPVTISGTTYVNFGSYVYKRETDNTYTKLTTAQTISGTSYTMYGGDGINSSGIALISSTPPPRPFFSMRSLYTNNAQVYYKSHSLSTGSGGSGVRNYRKKQLRT